MCKSKKAPSRVLGWIGVFTSLAVMLMSLIVLHDRDVYARDYLIYVLDDATVDPEQNTIMDDEEAAVLGLAITFTIQLVVYLVQIILQYVDTVKDEVKNGGRDSTKNKIRKGVAAFWAGDVMVNATVGFIITLIIDILLWRSYRSDGMVVSDDLSIICFVMQTGAMVVSWQMAYPPVSSKDNSKDTSKDTLQPPNQ